MEKEVWIPACGWIGLYEVSNLGRVRSVARAARTSLGIRSYGGGLLTPIQRKNGYLVVNLTSASRRKQELVHRLVIRSFSGDGEPDQEVCHCDGDRKNNAISNLRWDTRSGNHADKKKHGTWQGGENNPARKLSESQVRYIRSSGKGPTALADELGFSKGCIEKALYGATWKHVEQDGKK